MQHENSAKGRGERFASAGRIAFNTLVIKAYFANGRRLTCGTLPEESASCISLLRKFALKAVNLMPSTTRQRLIEAAARRFYRDGFRNVGIDQVLADVGISKTAFYKHFESKDDLMLAVLEMRRLDPSGNPFPSDAYVFGDRLGKRATSIRTAWENARDAAGLRGFQLRDLRHEAASRFEEAGVLTTDVSKFLGHRNLSTTTRYLNTTSRRLRLALMRVEEAQKARAESLANSCKDPQENTPHTDDAEAPSMPSKALVS